MIHYLLLLILGIVIFTSCEKEYTPKSFFDEPQIVVEGYIENGDSSLPPYVILTKSSPYLSKLGATELNNLFIHDADVRVTDGVDTVQLTEICLSDLAALDTALRNSVAQGIGLGTDSDSLNFCIYTDVHEFLTGQKALDIRVGGRYDLMVKTLDNQTVSATTTLTNYIPIDSFRIENHPNYPQNDSLVLLYGYFTDPATEQNYYRIFSKRNQEPMYPASSLGTGTSVTDDNIFNGQTFQFDILRGQPSIQEFDEKIYGYFWKGDTITIRGACVDRAHFRFWQTTEFNTSSQGPFGSYTRIESNINGGLGVWGGISYEDYIIIVPR